MACYRLSKHVLSGFGECLAIIIPDKILKKSPWKTFHESTTQLYEDSWSLKNATGVSDVYNISCDHANKFFIYIHTTIYFVEL